MPQHQKIQHDPNVDLDEVRRFLTPAWTSEIQLHLPAVMGNPGMLAFANTWAPVHAYSQSTGRSRRGSPRMK